MAQILTPLLSTLIAVDRYSNGEDRPTPPYGHPSSEGIFYGKMACWLGLEVDNRLLQKIFGKKFGRGDR
jgi:hypothetical protein